MAQPSRKPVIAWLFDILPELLADHRIQVVFTLNGEGSAYEAGVADAVCGIGGRILPWEQAVATPFSLAISASYYGYSGQCFCGVALGEPPEPLWEMHRFATELYEEGAYAEVEGGMPFGELNQLLAE